MEDELDEAVAEAMFPAVDDLWRPIVDEVRARYDQQLGLNSSRIDPNKIISELRDQLDGHGPADR